MFGGPSQASLNQLGNSLDPGSEYLLIFGRFGAQPVAIRPSAMASIAA